MSQKKKRRKKKTNQKNFNFYLAAANTPHPSLFMCSICQFFCELGCQCLTSDTECSQHDFNLNEQSVLQAA